MLNVKPIVYSALSTDAALPGLLPGGIHSNVNDNAGKYPALVYDEISNVPIVFADSEEQYSRSTMQISILTNGTSSDNIAERVNKVMLENGFMRQFSGDITNGKTKIKVLRYTIAG